MFFSIPYSLINFSINSLFVIMLSSCSKPGLLSFNLLLLFKALPQLFANIMIITTPATIIATFLSVPELFFSSSSFLNNLAFVF